MGTRSTRISSWNARPFACESLTKLVFPHFGHSRRSVQWSRPVIRQICAYGASNQAEFDCLNRTPAPRTGFFVCPKKLTGPEADASLAAPQKHRGGRCQASARSPRSMRVATPSPRWRSAYRFGAPRSDLAGRALGRVIAPRLPDKHVDIEIYITLAPRSKWLTSDCHRGKNDLRQRQEHACEQGKIRGAYCRPSRTNRRLFLDRYQSRCEGATQTRDANRR